MSTATIIEPREFAGFGIIRFTKLLISITCNSSHGHEQAVSRLLSDLADLNHTQQLDTGSYHAILGKSADVADFFNYDIDLLTTESNSWYRASIIHQMGLGMLQALERLRPDLTHLPFFAEATFGLNLSKKNNAKTHKHSGPLSYRSWANNLPNKN